MAQGPAPPPGSAAELFPEVYDYLRGVARRYFRAGGSPTLEPTGLVHEAYERLYRAGRDAARWRDREHFCAIAARAMRQILVDHYRKRAAAKREGGERITLSGLDAGSPDGQALIDVLALDEALARLGNLDARMAHVVELRIFGGMTRDEMAASLGVSPRTVDSDWRRARAWMARELGPGWRLE